MAARILKAERAPVEAGQWRKGGLGTVWAVLEPHPRRRGFWNVVPDGGAWPRVISMGRRELEAMPLVGRDYYGDRPHPGESYVQDLRQMLRSEQAP